MSDVRTMSAVALPLAHRRFSIRPAAIVAGATLIVFVYSLPYIYLLLTSFKPANDVLQIPPSFFPTRVSLENYAAVLANPSIPLAFGNSLLVAMGSTFLSLLLAVPAAY